MPVILDAIKGSRILETMENYPIAFTTGYQEGQRNEAAKILSDERSFWRNVLHDPDLYWNMEFDIQEAVFSAWIPRVPGFIFTPAAQIMRNFAKSFKPDSQNLYGDVYHVLRPAAKSAMVSGGLGTLKLPPDSNNNTMGCLSFSSDASTAIPLLISEEVKQHHKLTEGCAIKIKGARWRQMSVEWASKFPLIGGIPRGYMVVDRPEMVTKSEKNYGIWIYPFTIMEQQSDNGFLYDFVYVIVNSSDAQHRNQAVEFFDQYRSNEKHPGEYLLAIDPALPFFDARYILPKDLEEQDKYGKSQMNLMKERIKDASFKGLTIDKLAGIIPKYYTVADEIYRLAENSGISKSLIPNDATNKMTIVLLEKAAAQGKIPLMVENIVADFPQTLKIK